jgi:hypothetical protein
MTPTDRRPVVRIARFETRPEIDGRLDEEIWQRAAAMNNFYQTQPGDNTRPSYPTEVLLGFDAQSLYIGIRASDASGHVRATIAKRDDVLNDDHVSIFLDTFNDQQRAYVLVFNPLGVQQDGIYAEGSDIDYSVDFVMESKGVVTADGYTMEVAVPFRSLRYEAGRDKLWGVHIQRRIKHLNDEEDSWTPLRRGNSGFLSQAGHITGLEGIATERRFELIPSLTVSETGQRVRSIPRASLQMNPALIDPGRFVNSPVEMDPGLTMNFGITPNITLNVAINPDFAQVEADQLVVTANQRFPIFFEEKRPFFLEGIDIFQTPLKVVHTRTIVDPDLAVKLSGKRGRNTFGLMVASDNAPGNFSEEERTDPAIRAGIERFIDRNASVGILRLKRDIGSRSNVGLIATSYNFIEQHNQLAGVDGRFAFNPSTVLSFQLIGTTSRTNFYDPDRDENIYRTGNGFGYFTRLERTGRHLNLTLTGQGLTPDYRADVGFTTETNANRWGLTARYNSEPRPGAMLVSWSLENRSLAQFDWQGRMKFSYQYPQLFLNFKRQTYVNIWSYGIYSRLLEEEFGARRTATHQGAFFGAPERQTFYKGLGVEAGTTPSEKYSASIIVERVWNNFDYDFGAGPRFPRVSPAALMDPAAPLDPGTGDGLEVLAAFNWQPTDGLRLTFNYINSRLVRNDTRRVAFNQNLYNMRVTHQFTRFTFARARVDYDSLRSNIRGQFLLGWTPNPGTSFYVGYNDDLNRAGYNPFTNQYEPGLRRNSRTFFLKMSYLFCRNSDRKDKSKVNTSPLTDVEPDSLINKL